MTGEATGGRAQPVSRAAAGRPFYEMLLGGEAGEGSRHRLAGELYVVRDGILRQAGDRSADQAQTGKAFGFKWSKRETYESGSVQAFARDWLVERYLQGDAARRDVYFPADARVLDAGCGSGYSALALLADRLDALQYLGVDISEAVDVARRRFAERGTPGEFIQADFTRLPFAAPVFDTILAEGTLHHTDSTRHALEALTRLLVPGGHFLFYVYRRKGPIREFTDDLIRSELLELDDAAAWEALRPLTRLGEELGRMGVVIDVPEDIPMLGIAAGPVDLQRFFYWHVFKAFYRPDLSHDEMNHINFDWYRPRNAHRQSADEVARWCGELGLDIVHMDVQEAGITVVARKQG